MISVECVMCEKELDGQGWLLLSPPMTTDGRVDKLHLCIPCGAIIYQDILFTASVRRGQHATH